MPWAPDYVQLDDAKAYLRVPDDVDDEWIGALITAASRAIDARCHRQFGQFTGMRSYEASAAFPDRTCPGWWLLVTDDLRPDVPLQVTVGGVAVDPAGFVALPHNAAADGRVFTAVRLAARPSGLVAVGPGLGWPAVPAQVPVACRMQVARWHVRRESPFGVAGSPSDGSETRLLARLDPDVSVSLVGLSRVWSPR